MASDNGAVHRQVQRAAYDGLMYHSYTHGANKSEQMTDINIIGNGMHSVLLLYQRSTVDVKSGW